MIETIELRVREHNAHLVFPDDEGERMGTGLGSGLVRKVVIGADDPRIPLIMQVHEDLYEKGDSLFSGSYISRKYSKAELDSAEICAMWVATNYTAIGEEYGTVYDESTACAVCGAGGQQLSELFLDLRKIPKSKDASGTNVACEKVVSQRFHHVVMEHGLKGFNLPQVLPPLRSFRGKARVPVPERYYQLKASSACVDIISPTKIGSKTFWERGPVCPLGHYTSRWVLSELTVKRADWDGSDIFQTKQMFGIRRGFLRPYSIFLTTQRVRRVFDAAKLKGLRFEVAHFA